MQITPNQTLILVVDDEPDLRTLYELALLREGYRVETAATLAEARALLQAQHFDAVITDMRLPDGLGMALLYELREQQRPERCVVMTAYGSAENAVEALRAGAFDYLTKPVDLKQFRTVVASAVQGTLTQASHTPAGGGGSVVTGAGAAASPSATSTAQAALPSPCSKEASSALAQLIGESEPMLHLKQRIALVARSMAPVLIRGESGTGKELVSRALHASSQRAQGPLVAVNCGAIPENLLEAEFFGARKGSYTGATQDRPGFFQAACGGTLFLDEIGELPLAMQSKLLRAVQERKVRPLGATQEEAVDVRIISATHRDLAADVHSGRFRQDLYYRLNVIELLIPPLRERRSDLPALCQALLTRIAGEAGLPVPRLSQQALAVLNQYPLTGNVRELENLLHRAMALSDGQGGNLELADLPAQHPLASPLAPTLGSSDSSAATPDSSWGQEATHSPPSTLPSDLQTWLDQQEREVLIQALRESGYNRTAAAARLGMNLRQMRYRIERLNIPMPGDASAAAHGPQNH